MSKLCLLVASAIVLLASTNTGAQEAPKEKLTGNSVALEIRQFRDAWLFGDDESVSVRLESLEKDNRLQGVLPRWIGLMRAGHALRTGKPEIAEASINRVLKSAKDARPYFQAVRIYMLHNDTPRAMGVAFRGAAFSPESENLQILKADLTLLSGDHQESLRLYTNLQAKSADPMHAYQFSQEAMWGKAHEFNNPKAPNAPIMSLFSQSSWYRFRYAGLEKCLLEMAQDKDLAASMRAAIPELTTAHKTSEEALESFRGTKKERTVLELAERNRRWLLINATRVAVLAALESNDNHKALNYLKQIDGLIIEDIAMQALLAKVMGELGMAEEARAGPLSRLKSRADLQAGDGSLLYTDVGRMQVDCIFMPALNLYRVDTEAGKIQIEELRKSFGYSDRDVPYSLVGLWLLAKNETELARTYLIEASKFTGSLGGKPLGSYEAGFEFALWTIGPGDKLEKPNEAEENNTEQFKDILEQVNRAGAVISVLQDSDLLLQHLTDVETWGRASSIYGLVQTLPNLPGGRQVLERLIFSNPSELKSSLTQTELETILGDEHASSKNLKQSVEAISKTIEKTRTSESWRDRETLGKAIPLFFGKIESRAQLIRALFLHTRPQNLEDLQTWLTKWQTQIELRNPWDGNTDERTIKYRKAREAEGIPEIVHSGLLLDAADALVDAKDYASAAKLIWFNRDAYLGVDSIERLMWLASVLATKAGMKPLATQCRLTSIQGIPSRYRTNDSARLLLEMTDTRTKLLKYGCPKDVSEFIETLLLTSANTEDMTAILELAPEFKFQQGGSSLNRPAKDALLSIWESTFSQNSNSNFGRNWAKLASEPAIRDSCERMLDYLLASDLPIDEQTRYTGIVSTSGFLYVLAMKTYLKGSKGKTAELSKRLGGERAINHGFKHVYMRR